ncbi:hypothetical protein [Pseudomonas sp. 273]|uniref:hypothetical protein n=1 Tax=Pseudomonas sp. 273 TaxID=75692 RepID=UPI0023D8345E|nr:hypothetical protein [Pseudomonas sp. 273]
MRILITLIIASILTACASQGGVAGKNQIYAPFAEVKSPSSLRAISPAELISIAKSLGGAQGKFETNEAYFKRVGKVGDFEVCKKISDANLKFDQATGMTSYNEYLYDAQIAGYRDSPSDIVSNVDVLIPAVDVAFNSEKVGQYEGQNAFGATASVEVFSADSVHLVFDPIPKKPLLFLNPFLFSDPWSGAKDGNYSICITSVPVAPYYMESVRGGSPTLSNPNDGVVYHRFFRVKIAGMSIVDSQGKVVPVRVGISPGAM